MDLYRCKISGYAYATSMTAELGCWGVKNACLNVRETREIILHSDFGSQYINQAFENFQNNHGMIHSFSRKGNLYDNACIESFHSVLKKKKFVFTHTMIQRRQEKPFWSTLKDGITAKEFNVLLIDTPAKGGWGTKESSIIFQLFSKVLTYMQNGQIHFLLHAVERTGLYTDFQGCCAIRFHPYS